nr:uncharacterized protein LOC113826023 [Penaeus vannamei]
MARATPLVDTHAHTVARASIAGWISGFGVPTHLTSDGNTCSEDVRHCQTHESMRLSVNLLFYMEGHFYSGNQHSPLEVSYDPKATINFYGTYRITPYDSAGYSTLPYFKLPSSSQRSRSSFESDLGSTSAELVYGTSIRLTGEILCNSSGSITSPAKDHAAKLWAVMSKLRPVQPRQPSTRNSFVSRDLHDRTHVFVRVDSIRRPLSHLARAKRRS